jgi:hypothetical protein
MRAQTAASLADDAMGASVAEPAPSGTGRRRDIRFPPAYPETALFA